jgi:CO/xanthine dehydrogenase Mo-binding subunit
MSGGYVGQRVKRTEDSRLVHGRGRYVDDIRLAGTLHVAFVRSPHAHARIGAVDTTRAARASARRSRSIARTNSGCSRRTGP